MEMIETASARRIRLRYPALLSLGLAVTLALIGLSQVSPYYSGLSPRPGHRLWNATQPRGFLAGAFKEMQGFFEIQPCEYEILGWGPDGALYYRAQCRSQLQVWRAQPNAPASAQPAKALPPHLAAEQLPKQVGLSQVYAAGVWPVSAEPEVREMLVYSQVYPSPDGRWFAFVTRRIYGPQDVLLLTTTP
jgi:hypothetical protein